MARTCPDAQTVETVSEKVVRRAIGFIVAGVGRQVQMQRKAVMDARNDGYKY